MLLVVHGNLYIYLNTSKIHVCEIEATFIISSQDSDWRDKSRSKRSDLNEEDLAKAMSDEEDRSGEVAAGRIPDEIMKVAEIDADPSQRKLLCKKISIDIYIDNSTIRLSFFIQTKGPKCILVVAS